MSALARLGRIPGTAYHLSARFVTSLSPRPPAPADEVWAERHLLAGELRLWRQLSNQDRRHSIVVAQRFVARRLDHEHTVVVERAEVAGALLHDVGKIRCRLGTFGRVAATVVGPRGSRRFRNYHDHEAIGAEMAAGAGADPVTVGLIAGTGPASPDLTAVDHA